MSYTPILKGKSGEGAALKNLSNLTLDRTFPIIEIPPIPTAFSKDEPGVPEGKTRSLGQHLDVFVRGIAGRVPRDLKFAIDFCNLDRDESMLLNPIDYVFSKFRQEGCSPVPVLRTREDSKFAPELLSIVDQSNSTFVVRVNREDSRFPTAVLTRLSTLAATAGVSLAQLAVIFDYGMITRGDVDDVVQEWQAIEEELPLEQFFMSTVVATSMPDSVTLDLKPFDTDSIPRLEWQAWKQANLLQLGFGDYGVNSPGYFDEDIRLITIGGKARYTTPDSWMIVKGMKLEKNGDQFHKLAQIIRDSQAGRRPGYSWGDMCINACADFEIGPGNLTSWVAFTTNHHLTMVARQLANCV